MNDRSGANANANSNANAADGAVMLQCTKFESGESEMPAQHNTTSQCLSAVVIVTTHLTPSNCVTKIINGSHRWVVISQTQCRTPDWR